METGPVETTSQRRAENLLQRIVTEENLPDNWLHDAMTWFVPLAQHIASLHQKTAAPVCIGINGAQGTGKTTLARTLKMLLEQCHGLPAAALSLDDFYLSRSARQDLARSVHPLLVTRGVPGTHDTKLALDTISRLKHGQPVQLPAFDKAVDDVVAVENWQRLTEPVAVVLFEGWCVGIAPQSDDQLAEPVNTLEATQDPDGLWRRYVNTALAADYQTLFRQLDMLVMVKAPDFDCVFAWRLHQEQQLARRLTDSTSTIEAPKLRLMNAEQISRFIAHYQRLTAHSLSTLPSKADVVFPLDTNHRITAGLYREH
ncbi:MAG TPA: hypothetical protein DEG76_12755 [Pseudohongiella sp.]|nr:hypothetical protein [Pseudohongiella sp.]